MLELVLFISALMGGLRAICSFATSRNGSAFGAGVIFLFLFVPSYMLPPFLMTLSGSLRYASTEQMLGIVAMSLFCGAVGGWLAFAIVSVTWPKPNPRESYVCVTPRKTRQAILDDKSGCYLCGDPLGASDTGSRVCARCKD